MAIHYNTASNLTACYINKAHVYTTNIPNNVNCIKCLAEIKSNKKETTMQKCQYCQSELPDNHPAFIAKELNSTLNWTSIESDSNYNGYPVGKIFMSGKYTIEVMAKKLKPELDELEDGYSEEGAYPQGTTYNAYIVIKADNNFFRKDGTADSWGEISWDSALRTVTPTTKTITEYN